MSSLIVKRGGIDQPYDERKLYASLVVSLRIANESEKKAEIIASEVVTLLGRWLDKKSHVTSHDIRSHAAFHLKDYNHIAAYIYTHHRTLS